MLKVRPSESLNCNHFKQNGKSESLYGEMGKGGEHKKGSLSQPNSNVNSTFNLKVNNGAQTTERKDRAAMTIKEEISEESYEES